MMEPDTRLEPRLADRLSLLLALGFFATAILQGAIPVLAPGLIADGGMSAARVGLLMSAFLLTYALTQIPAGAFAARFPGRVLMLGFGAMVLGALLFAVSDTFVWYAFARGLQGVGAGTMIPAAGVLLVRHVPLDRLGRAWSIYGGASGVGYLLLLLVLARVVEAYGQRPFFFVVAGIALVVGVLTFISPQVRSGPPVGSSRLTARGVSADLLILMRCRRVTLLGLVNVAGVSVSIGTLTWTPSFLHDDLGVSLGVAAAVTAGFAGAQVVGAPVVAFLLTKVGYLPLLAVVFAGMVASMAAMPYLPGLITTLLVVMLVGLLAMIAFAPSFALIPVLVDIRLVGLAGGYLNAFGFVGALFGPWLFGIFIDRGWGYEAGYGMLAAFAVGGLLAIGSLHRALSVGPRPAGAIQ